MKTASITFEEALKSGKEKGMAHCDDAGLMAAFCNTSLQILCGAVSPKLVFEGAMKKGLSAKELLKLASEKPREVEELMWL